MMASFFGYLRPACDAHIISNKGIFEMLVRYRSACVLHPSSFLLIGLRIAEFSVMFSNKFSVLRLVLRNCGAARDVLYRFVRSDDVTTVVLDVVFLSFDNSTPRPPRP
jgi:hypothetical protein